VDMLDKGMIHIPGGMQQDSERFHYVTHNGLQFKTDNSFITEFFDEYITLRLTLDD
jgi:hypothetical protein